MRSTDRTVLAVVLSLFLAGFTLAPLTTDKSYLGASWGFFVVLGLATALLRRARVGTGMVLLTQLAVAGVLSVAFGVAMPGLGLPWYQHYLGLWQGGILHMQEQASPMDPNDGVTLIFATLLAGLLIITDLLAAGLARPAWALAPTATLFLVPALGLGADTGLMSFLLVALGYLGILLADGLNTSARWTRGLSRDTAESVGAAPVVWRAASLIGVPALVATLLLGSLLPTLSLPGFGFGGGTGGNGPLQLTDPSLDLRRNLSQPLDKEVINYTTDGEGGQYLRLASLPRFSAQGWSNVAIRLNTGEDLPAPPGLSASGEQERTTRINVLDFRSQYLPMPYAPRSFTAAGDWRYDANSLTVVNGDNRAESLANLSYTVRSVDVAPDPERLAGAVAGTPADATVTRQIPGDLPQDLLDFSRRVTQDADTPAAKAAAIQAHLRSSRYTYDVTPLPGTGYGALQNFLFRDRRGYCEQYAAAMAMMARVAGIPSRVSVGFLPGREQGGTWRVSIRDLHAWPELYFAGHGWVRYEPTPPSDQTRRVPPPWTLNSENDPGSTPSDAPESEPSASVDTPSSAPSDTLTEDPTTTGATATFPWARTLAGTGIGLLVVAVLAAPATVRVRRRSARLGGDQLAEEQVESAWAEIRDTVLDYGGDWPSGSPRAIGSAIGAQLDTEESAAMGTVATLVERSRYARSVGDPAATATLPQLTAEVRRGLAAPLTRRQRLLSLVLPRSLFRRRRRA